MASGELSVPLDLVVKARSAEDARVIADILVDELRSWLEVFVEAAVEDKEDVESIIPKHGDFSAYLETDANDDWKEDEGGKG